MLTLGDGEIIAQVTGGACDGELISIKQDQKINCGCCGGCSNKCFIKKCCKKCNRGIDLGDRILLKDEGKLMFTPLADTRDIIFLGAESGAGKSTLIRKYIDIYREMFPRNPVFLFSRKTDDEVFQEDFIKPVNINNLDPEKEYDLINSREFKNGGLVIFDDTNTILNKEIKSIVNGIMHDIMEVGRSKKIYMAISYHLLNPNEKNDGRVIWNEAKGIVIFPQSGNFHAIEYALTNYLGFDKDTIDEIMALPSRWVIIRKLYPKVIIHEKGAFIPKYKPRNRRGK